MKKRKLIIISVVSIVILAVIAAVIVFLLPRPDVIASIGDTVTIMERQTAKIDLGDGGNPLNIRLRWFTRTEEVQCAQAPCTPQTAQHLEYELWYKGDTGFTTFNPAFAKDCDWQICIDTIETDYRTYATIRVVKYDGDPLN